ncbi:MAG: thioredoxin domain-containing protein [Anaerolineales bacterium]
MGLKIPSQAEIQKLPPDGGSHYNRLVFEKSPYLLQHAANPVDWHPWGEEAFELARDQDKPVFLSIGYATCHWCHVMEKESFEDPDTAETINRHFIPIKVDREERPDIDQIYMAVCQAVIGSGGWPLTVLLTADKKPFFVGTYFPRESRFGRTGLLELLPKAADLWANKREELLNSAEALTEHLRDSNPTGQGRLEAGLFHKAYRQLESRFDELHGGFGSAPKFPTPHNLVFLLRYWKLTGEGRALEMVEKTLTKMRLGGMYDQVGFGFHRYSTDPAWRLPHFEKMLYDQALLALAYLEAYQATSNERYADIAHEILEYVRRDMTAPEGSFYSAEDADSEGEEGLFYLWSADEFRQAAGEESGDLFADIFNIQEQGNFAEESTQQMTGLNLLYLEKPLPELAAGVKLAPGELAARWEASRQDLFAVREQRIHPLKDDKILTDWNGLMIAAFARAGAVLEKDVYLQAAAQAFDFIWDHLRRENGRLLKRYRAGSSGLAAHLDDYAFLVWGLLELYQAGFDSEHLRSAKELTDIMLEDFWDEDKGGFFFTASGQKDLIHRSKEIYDGAIPSGNSVAFNNLIRLGRLLANPEYEEKAQRIGEAFAAQVNQLPQGYTELMIGLLRASNPSCEVVISGTPDSTDAREMLSKLRSGYFPNCVVLLRPDKADERLFDLVPQLRQQTAIDGKATAYVCHDFLCSKPTNDPQTMFELIASL